MTKISTLERLGTVAMAPTRQDLRVLIYEPDVPRARAWTREFSREGYEVTFADSLGQAENLARKNDFDVALLDVDLPHQESRRLLHFLRESRPETTVCMVTDYGDEELWIDLVNEGASDLLCRPVQCRDIEKCLAHKAK